MTRPKLSKDTLDKNSSIRSINQVVFKMIICPKGSFWMGTKDYVQYNNEMPMHKVKMNKKLWMGETQVTQELWNMVMKWNPSTSKNNIKLPVDSVTWYDCLIFCNKLSELDGFVPCFSLTNIEMAGDHTIKATVEWNRNANGYRLPTEAEWEYCAKAGTELIYSGSNDITEVAWYRESSNNETHEVKTKKPNAWGLYDMSGNVSEWCMDQYDKKAYKDRKNKNNVENPILWSNTPSTHILRGGSYLDSAVDCRVAVRHRFLSDRYLYWTGFRLVRS
jgi:sulfatase modifying factor 1